VRRLVALAVVSLVVTVALVGADPTNRTATLRLEVVVLALLGALALVRVGRDRVPDGDDPPPGPVPARVPASQEPAAVAAITLALRLALSPHPQARRSAEQALRGALAEAGADPGGLDVLPVTVADWDELLDGLGAKGAS